MTKQEFITFYGLFHLVGKLRTGLLPEPDAQYVKHVYHTLWRELRACANRGEGTSIEDAMLAIGVTEEELAAENQRVQAIITSRLKPRT